MVKALAHLPRWPRFESRPTMWIELVVSSPMPSARKKSILKLLFDLYKYGEQESLSEWSSLHHE